MKEITCFPFNLTSGFYRLKIEKETNEINVEERMCLSSSLFLDTKEEPFSLTFNIKENSSLNLDIFIKGESNNYSFVFNLEKNSFLDLSFSSFQELSIKSSKTINLKGDGSSVKVIEFESSSSAFTKEGVFRINHLAENTSSDSSFIYIAKDKSIIKKEATSYIAQSMKKSKSNEQIRGLILDKSAKIEAKPNLLISFDDVNASHGCAIGNLNDNEVYYLMSRGLTKEDAINIITKGLVIPVLNHSKESEFKELIEPYLFKTVGR